MPVRPSTQSSTVVPALVPQGPHQGKPSMPLGRAFTMIGARHRAHLHLLSRSVSKAHAVLVNDNGNLYIRDTASREHVYVNGKQVHEGDLKHGDLIKIGSFTFQVVDGARRSGKSPRKTAPKAVVATADSVIPTDIDGRTLVIGRRSTCDLILGELAVSNVHAIIFQFNGQYYIRDLGSRTGTYVNGEQVHQQSLQFDDQIRIGDHDLQFAAASAPEESESIDELEHLIGTAPLGDESNELANADAFGEVEETIEPLPVAEPAITAARMPLAPPMPVPPADDEPRLGEERALTASTGDLTRLDADSESEMAGLGDTRALPPEPPPSPRRTPVLSPNVVDEVDDAGVQAEERQLLVGGDLHESRLPGSGSFSHLQHVEQDTSSAEPAPLDFDELGFDLAQQESASHPATAAPSRESDGNFFSESAEAASADPEEIPLAGDQEIDFHVEEIAPLAAAEAFGAGSDEHPIEADLELDFDAGLEPPLAPEALAAGTIEHLIEPDLDLDFNVEDAPPPVASEAPIGGPAEHPGEAPLDLIPLIAGVIPLQAGHDHPLHVTSHESPQPEFPAEEEAAALPIETPPPLPAEASSNFSIGASEGFTAADGSISDEFVPADQHEEGSAFDLSPLPISEIDPQSGFAPEEFAEMAAGAESSTAQEMIRDADAAATGYEHPGEKEMFVDAEPAAIEHDLQSVAAGEESEPFTIEPPAEPSATDEQPPTHAEHFTSDTPPGSAPLGAISGFEEMVGQVGLSPMAHDHMAGGSAYDEPAPLAAEWATDPQSSPVAHDIGASAPGSEIFGLEEMVGSAGHAEDAQSHEEVAPLTTESAAELRNRPDDGAISLEPAPLFDAAPAYQEPAPLMTEWVAELEPPIEAEGLQPEAARRLDSATPPDLVAPDTHHPPAIPDVLTAGPEAIVESGPARESGVAESSESSSKHADIIESTESDPESALGVLEVSAAEPTLDSRDDFPPAIDQLSDTGFQDAMEEYAGSAAGPLVEHPTGETHHLTAHAAASIEPDAAIGESQVSADPEPLSVEPRQDIAAPVEMAGVSGPAAASSQDSADPDLSSIELEQAIAAALDTSAGAPEPAAAVSQDSAEHEPLPAEPEQAITAHLDAMPTFEIGAEFQDFAEPEPLPIDSAQSIAAPADALPATSSPQREISEAPTNLPDFDGVIADASNVAEPADGSLPTFEEILASEGISAGPSGDEIVDQALAFLEHEQEAEPLHSDFNPLATEPMPAEAKSELLHADPLPREASLERAAEIAPPADAPAVPPEDLDLLDFELDSEAAFAPIPVETLAAPEPAAAVDESLPVDVYADEEDYGLIFEEEPIPQEATGHVSDHAGDSLAQLDEAGARSALHESSHSEEIPDFLSEQETAAEVATEHAFSQDSAFDIAATVAPGVIPEEAPVAEVVSPPESVGPLPDEQETAFTLPGEMELAPPALDDLELLEPHAPPVPADFDEPVSEPQTAELLPRPAELNELAHAGESPVEEFAPEPPALAELESAAEWQAEPEPAELLPFDAAETEPDFAETTPPPIAAEADEWVGDTEAPGAHSGFDEVIEAPTEGAHVAHSHFDEFVEAPAEGAPAAGVAFDPAMVAPLETPATDSAPALEEAPLEFLDEAPVGPAAAEQSPPAAPEAIVAHDQAAAPPLAPQEDTAPRPSPGPRSNPMLGMSRDFGSFLGGIPLALPVSSMPAPKPPTSGQGKSGPPARVPPPPARGSGGFTAGSGESDAFGPFGAARPQTLVSPASTVTVPHAPPPMPTTVFHASSMPVSSALAGNMSHSTGVTSPMSSSTRATSFNPPKQHSIFGEVPVSLLMHHDADSRAPHLKPVPVADLNPPAPAPPRTASGPPVMAFAPPEQLVSSRIVVNEQAPPVPPATVVSDSTWSVPTRRGNATRIVPAAPVPEVAEEFEPPLVIEEPPLVIDESAQVANEPTALDDEPAVVDEEPALLFDEPAPVVVDESAPPAHGIARPPAFPAVLPPLPIAPAAPPARGAGAPSFVGQRAAATAKRVAPPPLPAAASPANEADAEAELNIEEEPGALFDGDAAALDSLTHSLAPIKDITEAVGEKLRPKPLAAARPTMVPPPPPRSSVPPEPAPAANAILRKAPAEQPPSAAAEAAAKARRTAPPPSARLAGRRPGAPPQGNGKSLTSLGETPESGADVFAQGSMHEDAAFGPPPEIPASGFIPPPAGARRPRPAGPRPAAPRKPGEQAPSPQKGSAARRPIVEPMNDAAEDASDLNDPGMGTLGAAPGAARKKKKKWKFPFLGVVALGLAAGGAGAGIWYALPPRSDVKAALRFEGLDKLSSGVRRDFEQDQVSRLATEDFRRGVQGLYESQFHGHPGDGFLYRQASGDVDFAAIVDAGHAEGDRFVLEHKASSDRDGDRVRFRAVLQALYAIDSAQALLQHRPLEASQADLADAERRLAEVQRRIADGQKRQADFDMARKKEKDLAERAGELEKTWSAAGAVARKAQADLDALLATAVTPPAPGENDSRLKELSTRLKKLSDTLDAVHAASGATLATGVGSLDMALAQYQQQIDSTRLALNGGAGLGAYLGIAQQARISMQQAAVDLAARQKASRQALADLKRTLAEKTAAHVKRAYADNAALVKLEQDRAVQEHRLGAATSAGLTDEAAQIRIQMGELKTAIDARRAQITAADASTDEIRSIQKMISDETGQTRADIASADQRIVEQMSLIAAANPKPESLPDDHARQLSLLDQKLAVVNVVRQQTAQTGDPAPAIDEKLLKGQIADLQTQIDARQKELIDAAKASSSASIDAAMLAQKRMELEDAQKAEARAMSDWTASKQALIESQASLDAMQSTQPDLVRDNAELEMVQTRRDDAKRQGDRLASAIIPLPQDPQAADLIEVSHPSDYRPVALAGVAALFAIGVGWLIRRARRRAMVPVYNAFGVQRSIEPPIAPRRHPLTAA